MKYDDNNSNSHTAFQPSNRSTINVKMAVTTNTATRLRRCKVEYERKWDAAASHVFPMPEAATCKPRAEESPVRYVEADIIGYSTKSGPR
ncbi:hypothetical protein EVAR_86675_1 [Eumeta japonica]|uniref:Uncharacterized protein n=1 Tax=Eumeta variegata TaxID=151549 RepID=A0A4C1XZW1_EUMVA|nr:hypothetical protein EVAR_86675_1 [Eumeta japonica]